MKEKIQKYKADNLIPQLAIILPLLPYSKTIG